MCKKKKCWLFFCDQKEVFFRSWQSFLKRKNFYFLLISLWEKQKINEHVILVKIFKKEKHSFFFCKLEKLFFLQIVTFSSKRTLFNNNNKNKKKAWKTGFLNFSLVEFIKLFLSNNEKKEKKVVDGGRNFLLYFLKYNDFRILLPQFF